MLDDGKHGVPDVDTGEENDFKLRIDLRTLLLKLRTRLWLLVVLAAIVFCAFFGGMRIYFRNSMNKFTAVAKVFHQTRQERVATFYKQLDAKSVAALFRTSSTMAEAAERLDFSHGAAAGLERLVTVSVDKSMPNIIVISANYNTAAMATSLANAVADAGVDVYIKFQNSTLQGMLNERRRRCTQLSGELTVLEAERAKYITGTTSLSPEDELRELRSSISDCSGKLAEARIRQRELIIRIQNGEDNLKTMDKEVTMQRRIRSDTDAELTKLHKELLRIRQLYTDVNPRVIQLREEIAGREKLAAATTAQSSDEIVMQLNSIYVHMQESILMQRMELQGVEQREKEFQRQLDEFRRRALEVNDKVARYNDLLRRIDSTRTRIAQLEAGINDFDVLLNSTIPDISVLEYASKPQKKRDKVLVFSLLLTIVVVGGGTVLLVALEAFFGRIKSSRELALIMDIADLGGTPAVSAKVSLDQQNSAEMAVLRRIMTSVGDGGSKRLFICRLDDSVAVPHLSAVWLDNLHLNGLRTFRLRCVPYAHYEVVRGEFAGKTFQPTELDSGLVCVEKFSDQGVFSYNSELFMTSAEVELLKADIKHLASHYDFIMIDQVFPPAAGGQVCMQLVGLADYSVFIAAFDRVPKQVVRHLTANIRSHNLEFDGGAVLAEVGEPYWSGK